MIPERDLERLQRQMAPELRSDTFVYCSFNAWQLAEGLEPLCTFREAEGLTAIITKAQAIQYGVDFLFEARHITLTVHSSLDAVGFMASVSRALADASIPCNVVSAYFHDHLFVPSERASEAMEILHALQRQPGSR